MLLCSGLHNVHVKVGREVSMEVFIFIQGLKKEDGSYHREKCIELLAALS